MIKILDDKGISLYINSLGTDIKISLNKRRDNCVYACYLYFEGEVVKYHYQYSLDFPHKIDLYNSKVLEFRYFIWDKKRDIRTSESISVTEQLEIFSTYSFFLDSDLNGYLLDKHIEHYISNEENVERGKILFEENKLKLTSFAPVEWEDWEADPFNNRSWQWALHWFDFNKHLLAFHYKTHNNEVLHKLKELINNWIDNYLYNENTNFEFIWHDHATSLRAEQILLLLYYLKKHNFLWMTNNFRFVSKLLVTLNVIGKKLEQEDFYSKHTNHGLEQVRVLILLGLILNNKVWVAISILRLNDELEFSFTSEGVHKENSPGYHQFVFKVFLSIIEEFPSYVLKDLGPKFNDIASKALTYITYILRPDKNLPIIGDTELKPITDSYNNFFSGTVEYENFIYSLNQGRRGIAPLKNNIVYPKSGYAILRNTWGNDKNFTDSIQLIFKAGCLSKYHHQQDENTFVLYAFGEDWLIDSGLYNYINKDPIRNYARRRQAHNIPVISNTSYDHDDFNHRIDNWSIYDYSEDNLNPYVAAKNRVLVTVEHDRKIAFDANRKSLLIEDKVVSIDEKHRDITFLFHFPNDKEIEIQEELVSIASSKKNIRFLMSFSVKPESIIIERGIVKGSVKSVVSNISRKYDESQVMKVVYKNVNVLKVSTTMIFI